MDINRCGNTADRKVTQKEAENENKYEFVYRARTNVVRHEMWDYVGRNWSHRESNKRFKKKLEAIRGKHSIDPLQKTAILEHHT